MTAVFRIGLHGNGDVYYGQTEKQIKKLIKNYEKMGYKVTQLGSSFMFPDQLWFQIDEENGDWI